jgi:molybdate transport repressor ModE-like protein
MLSNMLDVHRLRILREIAQRGTLTAAAKALYLTPPSVSHHMAALEQETGVKLLERVGRGVRLTPVAQRLVKSSEALFAAMERAEAELALARDEVVGQVTVASFMSALMAIVIPSISGLTERYPALDVLVVDIDQPKSMAELRSGRVDLALGLDFTIEPAEQDTDLDYEPLLSEPVFLALPSTHPRASGPIAIADLCNERWIAPADDPCRQAVLQSAAFCGFTPQVSPISSSHYEVIISAVAAGLGVTLLPAMALTGRPEPGLAIHPLTDVPLRRRISAAMRQGSRSNPAIAVVLAALKEQSDALAAGFPQA